MSFLIFLLLAAVYSVSFPLEVDGANFTAEFYRNYTNYTCCGGFNNYFNFYNDTDEIPHSTIEEEGGHLVSTGFIKYLSLPNKIFNGMIVRCSYDSGDEYETLNLTHGVVPLINNHSGWPAEVDWNNFTAEVFRETTNYIYCSNTTNITLCHNNTVIMEMDYGSMNITYQHEGHCEYLSIPNDGEIIVGCLETAPTSVISTDQTTTQSDTTQVDITLTIGIVDGYNTAASSKKYV